MGVKTERILIDVGHMNKCQIDAKMKKKAKVLSEEYAVVQQEKRKAKELKRKSKNKKSKDWQTDDEYGGWSPPKWDDFKEDQSDGLYNQKLLYSKTLLDKNKGKKAEKKKHHTEI